VSELKRIFQVEKDKAVARIDESLCENFRLSYTREIGTDENY
jgi:hypothetical protein